MYSIPTTRGSSGSPIFNDDGYLVGMIQARLINFSNIALSALYNDIVKVVKMVKSGKLKAEK
jgi:V8-like Glu-specific endopeptidase